MTGKSHWDRVYETRDEATLSWYADQPQPALALAQEFGHRDRPLIDIGGGASRLVDALLDAGFGDLTVLDLSAQALARARARLGDRAARVRWITADITDWQPARAHTLWNDRAVFHFLTAPGDRAAYVAALAAGLAPGGHAIIATFADDGPERCSGLPVARYAPGDLAGELDRLAPGLLAPVRALRHDHETPGGAVQRFQTSVFRRIG